MFRCSKPARVPVLTAIVAIALGLAASNAVASDVNGDGRVDLLDVQAALEELLGRDEAPSDPDCTGDGFVSIADAVCILNAAGCGLDLTPPKMDCHLVQAAHVLEDHCLLVVPLPPVHDACDLAPLVSAQPRFVFGQGFHDVAYRAEDAWGNVSTCKVQLEIVSCPEGPAPPALLPVERDVLSGGKVTFDVVLADAPEEIPALCFFVDGVEDGSLQTGFLEASEDDPLVAVYQAPEVAAPIEVEIAAARCDEPGLALPALVRTWPLSGTTDVLPNLPAIGLGTQRQFVAGMEIAGNFFPHVGGFWRVNGILGGNVGVGLIDGTGLYSAPKLMPGPAPFPLDVSFALSSGAPALAMESFTLTELGLDPRFFVSTEEGPAGIVNASLVDSDGVVTNLPRTALLYQPGNPLVADVDGASQVIIGPMLGQAQIQGLHLASGAVDHVVAQSRSDIELTLDAQRRTNDLARFTRAGNGHLQRLEYTAPGAVFDVVPQVRILRGGQAGSVLGGFGGTNFSIESSGGVMSFGPGDPLPQPLEAAGGIYTHVGMGFTGLEPGTGTITVTYDDGFATGTSSMDLLFSRIELAVTAKGDRSSRENEAFITEYIHLDFEATNPNGDFLGEIPLEITLGEPGPDAETFLAATFLNIHTGNTAQPFLVNELEETDRLRIQLNSTDHRLGFAFDAGMARVMIAPRRPGEHRLTIRVANDPGFEPIELIVMVDLPPLELHHPRGFVLPEGARVMQGSYVDVWHRGPGVPLSPFDLFQEPVANVFTRFTHNDLPFWSIFPGPEIVRVTNAVAGGGRLPKVWQALGEHQVRLGLTDADFIRSADLPLEVFDPSTVAIRPFHLDNEDGQAMPPAVDNSFGAFRILSVPSEPWIPGMPHVVQVQTLRADGTPGAIGKTRQDLFFNDDVPPSETIRHDLIGVNSSGLVSLGFSVLGVLHPRADDGIIEITIQTPEEGSPLIGEDLIMRLRPKAYMNLSEAAFTGALPVHQRQFFNGNLGSETPATYGKAILEDSVDRMYQDQGFLVPGRGIVAMPRQWSVPRQRVLDLMNAGRLPAGSDLTRVSIFGNAGFPEAIASGSPAFTLGGEGITIVSATSPSAFRLELELRISPAVTLGDRNVELTFPDGSTWRMPIELAGIFLHHSTDHGDMNLPLNANHHQAHPVGSQLFLANNLSFDVTFHSIDLELEPSIREGASFRGAVADQPLVGFKRVVDGLTGATRVSDLTMTHLQRNNNAFLVFGNVSDQRRLDRATQVLGPAGFPDGLPDFVSTGLDGELLIARVGGNVLDVLPFTAFNLMAEVQQDLPPRGLDFDDVRSSIGDACDAYFSPVPSLTSGQLDASLGDEHVTVSVDHEASGADLDVGTNLLKAIVPQSYHGGVLDQAYIRTVLAAATFDAPGRDPGRVDSFDGDRGGSLSITGRTREGFGIELAGVLFDPSASLLDPDEPPNGATLLCLPIVSDCVGSLPSEDLLTVDGLLPEQGGTSGGFYDLDAAFPCSHHVVSKTPGHEFPGLHAGYLLGGHLDDMMNRSTGTQADDIEDVIVRRASPGAEASAVGGAILDESLGFTRQQRRVNGFAQARDFSDPISTTFTSTRQFLLTTDPPGLPAFRYKAALLVREKAQPSSANEVDLLVTTMSTGNEAIQKALVDFVIDVTVNVTSAAVLGTLTGGVCGTVDVGGDIFTAGVTLALDLAENEVLDGNLPPANAKPLRLAHAILRDGQPVAGFLPGVQVSVSSLDPPSPTVSKLVNKLRGIAEEQPVPTRADRVAQRWGAGPSRLVKVPLCSALGAPFNVLKDQLKAAVSVEGLGGNGSAEAIGHRVLSVALPEDTHLQPGALYNAHWDVRRVINIIPKEPAPREIPGGSAYLLDPTEVPDAELLARLLDDAAEHGEDSDAQELLRRMAVNSVWRRPDHEAYDAYKVRWARLPELEMVIVPGAALEELGEPIGDFVLTNDETIIPVSVGSSVLASRSNENAGARASTGIDHVEVILLEAIILQAE